MFGADLVTDLHVIDNVLVTGAVDVIGAVVATDALDVTMDILGCSKKLWPFGYNFLLNNNKFLIFLPFSLLKVYNHMLC